ncbi:MAG: DUF2807 domain-containing protein [Crocinitomicaceae bacterium]
MQEVNKNIDHLFAKVKTAKVNLSAQQVVAGVAGASVLGAAATTSLISKFKIMSIMLGSGIAITTTVLLMNASPEVKETASVIPMENEKKQISIEPKISEPSENLKVFYSVDEPKEEIEHAEIPSVELVEVPDFREDLIIPEVSEFKERKLMPQDITEVGDFHSIVVQIDCDVELFAGETCGTEVLQSELTDVIDFSIEGGVLTVGIKEGREKDFHKVAKHQIVEVELTMKNLKNIQVQGAAVVHSDDDISSSDLNVTIQGSGDVSLYNVAPKSYEVVLSGSGDVVLKGNGSATKGTVTISGSGDVCIPNLAADKVDVQISGSGDVNVNAKSNLNVQIAGSGDVSYTGDPETSVSISGSGEVHKGCNKD